ncbi:6-hydroxymethylpterin diphosphokinase MptE-like protein [Halarcobacter sp.]|uniref:6-hydroxymethylpterin diphosphokinase MptE-like protein n=1 Tax=Halarcobacter sp. TaxID=2321133 RepID=UPI002AA8605A|nr:6-hydroxymethylpterin diphosphokinase MptE-like protein [Halarcobacter sp.]
MLIKNLNLKNKKVYLAPKNINSKYMESYIKLKGANFLSYIDNFSNDCDVVSAKDISEHDLIIIVKTKYLREILKSINSNKIFVLINSENGIYNPKYYDILSILCKDRISKILFKIKVLINFLPLSRNYFNIKKFQKTHKRIFIVGNGPSLNVHDLEKLKMETTIAANKIFLAFQNTSWRPTYYTIEDPLDLKEYYDSLSEFELGQKFFPFTTISKKLKNSLYYKQLTLNNYKNVKISNNPISGFYSGESVVFTMFQFAMFLKAKEIYLIGFDHNYIFPTKNSDALYKVSCGEQNHFHKDYRKKGDLWAEPRIDNITYQFEIINDYAKSNNVRIFNATRGGSLEVFPRVDFENIVNQ